MLEVFYDGSCPFCSRQAARLRRLDKLERLRLTNLYSEPFALEIWGIRFEDASARLHCVDDISAEVFVGFDALLEILRRVEMTRTVWFFKLPVAKQIGEFIFSLFSSNRKRF